MQRTRFWAAAGALAIVLAGVVVPGVAHANPYDISLAGLGRPDLDPTGAPQDRLRHLSAELSFAMAPRPMQPAETLGISGFEFSIANTLSSISDKADYWQGQPGSPVMEGADHGHQVPGALWVPSAHLRKGLPFSTEVGIQASYLAQSNLVMLGGEFKIAIHESFYRWLPSLSARIAVGRLLGSSELDLFTAEGDALASLPFGIGGMVQVTPYLGYGQLATQVNSYVIDETPYVVRDPNDQKGGADGSLYTFKTIMWNHARYQRLFGGLRVKTASLELLYELDANFLGTSFDDKRLLSHTFKIGFDI